MEGISDQKAPIDMIATLNEAYFLSIYGNSSIYKEQAAQAFYDCHDQLRRQRIKFHLEPHGPWVIDEEVGV